MAIRRPGLSSLARTLLFAAFAPSLLGCMSGRVASIDITDRAVIVRDGHYATVAILREGGVDRIAGERVFKMDADARWAVMSSTVVVPGTILSDPDRDASARLPWPSPRHVLTAVCLEDGRRVSLPNGLEEDDWWVWSIVVSGASVFAEVAPRYISWIDKKPHRYWRKHLPDGEWESVSEAEWYAADDAARSRVAYSLQAPPWSIPVGAHGTLWVNRDGRTWTTTIVAPNKGTTVVLRENDWGLSNTSTALIDAMPGHWP